MMKTGGTMLYRKVPKNGDELSILGFGAMRLPQRLNRIDEKSAAPLIYHAIDQGLNYVDTAWPYHGGQSEPFVGKILSVDGYRDKIKLATKLPHWQTKNSTDMHDILNKQLERLRTDHIDYYLVHNLNGASWKRAREKGVIEFLDQALESGKILNAGFSYHGMAMDFNAIVDDYDWTFCQMQYNYLDTQSQGGTAGLEYAASQNLAIIVMEPLRGGNLAKTPPPEIRKIWDSAETQKTPAEWSLRWLWDKPQVTVILSGMNHMDQINENLAIASTAVPTSMSEPDKQRVNQAADTFRSLMKAGCTGCQYCMPCPHGVNIPFCFDTYNSKTVFKDKRATYQYLVINGGIVSSKPGLASQCTECGACLSKCPQSLPIPDLLKDVEKEFERFWTKPFLNIVKSVMRIQH